MYFSRITYKPELATMQLVDIIERSGAYGSHQLMWGFFNDNTNKARNFIYREEVASKQLKGSIRRKADPVYYVVSEELPIENHPLLNIESKPYDPQLNSGDRFYFKLRANLVVSRNGKKHDVPMDSQVQWLNQALAELDCGSAKGSKAKKDLILANATDQHFECWQEIVDSGPFADVLNRQFTARQLLDWVLKTQREAAVIKWWQRQQDKGFEITTNQFGHLSISVDSYQQQYIGVKGPDAKFAAVDLSGEITVTDPQQFKQLLFTGIGRKKAFGCGLMMIRKAV